MALHDFWCQSCGRVFTDINVPIAIGQAKGAPTCPDCQLPTNPIPGVGRMDVGGVKGVAFKAFTTRDGRNNLVTIDSFHKLRQVERESEQLARNGEGQQVNWRRASQNHSNREVPTLGSLDGSERPDPAYVKKFGGAIKSAVEPEAKFGPGVNESNTSALPMEGGK